MPQELPKDVSIVFERNKDANTFPVTGIWGGSSPDVTNLVAHFYTEYKSTPNSIKADVQEGGRVDVNAGERISRGDITREIQGTMVLRPETAISIGQWLIQKGQEMIDQTNQGNQ